MQRTCEACEAKKGSSKRAFEEPEEHHEAAPADDIVSPRRKVAREQAFAAQQKQAQKMREGAAASQGDLAEIPVGMVVLIAHAATMGGRLDRSAPNERHDDRRQACR